MLISNKEISNDSKTFIVAEIGANHNNDLELLKKTINAAAEAGVDAVKFQTYTAIELLSDYDREFEYKTFNGEKHITKIGEMFDELALPREWHKEIFEYANSLGLIAFSTPFSEDGVNFLNKSLNVPCFKVAASDVNYLSMLKEIGETKKPTMLSLGKCSIGEADEAINTLKSSGCNDLVIMHCVSQYPSPMEDMNLKTIQTLKSMYPDCIVGFSDHSIGITSAIGAVVLGAKVIEKHFTLSKELEGPDHWFSMNPTEMKELVKSIREIEIALGTSEKRIVPSEKKERHTSIRSICLKEDIKAGERISLKHIKFTRPGWGIEPRDAKKIIGMKINKNLSKNSVLEWKYFK